MGLNESVEIYVPVMTKSTSGQIIKNWAYKQTPVCPPNIILNRNVWPLGLSPFTNAQWGISDIPTNSKEMIGEYNQYISIGNRAKIDSLVYDIKASNFYTVKQHALLVPVQGEA
jgi:hypothetical protein